MPVDKVLFAKPFLEGANHHAQWAGACEPHRTNQVR